MSKKESLDTISNNYLRGSFVIDFIVFMPFGYLASLLDERLRLLWIIKAFRINELRQYMRESMYKPKVNLLF